MNCLLICSHYCRCYYYHYHCHYHYYYHYEGDICTRTPLLARDLEMSLTTTPELPWLGELILVFGLTALHWLLGHPTCGGVAVVFVIVRRIRKG